MSSEEEPVTWLRKEIGDDLAFARACLQRPIWGTDFDAVNERVARCEAELAILDEHSPEWTDYRDGDGIERTSLECSTCEPPGTPDNYPCKTVRLLASGYRHRAGFPAAFAA